MCNCAGLRDSNSKDFIKESSFGETETYQFLSSESVQVVIAVLTLLVSVVALYRK